MAFRSTVYCRKTIEYSNNIKIRICIIAQGSLERPGTNFSCPLPRWLGQDALYLSDQEPLMSVQNVSKPGSPQGISVQFSSVAQSCPTLCDPMKCSIPGLLVHNQLLEFTQTHIHRVGDAIQPSHPLSSPSPPAPNPSQHQSFPMSQLFAWGGQSTGVSDGAYSYLAGHLSVLLPYKSLSQSSSKSLSEAGYKWTVSLLSIHNANKLA